LSIFEHFTPQWLGMRSPKRRPRQESHASLSHTAKDQQNYNPKDKKGNDKATGKDQAD
jgi:hypothetical protein